jgi:hypothetical protein
MLTERIPMNIADKLQEIADRISALANTLTVVQEELAKAITAIREQVHAQSPEHGSTGAVKTNNPSTPKQP